jgi:hypothetical protein
LGNASQFKKELEGAVAATSKANSGFAKFGKAAGVAGLALGGVLAVGLEKSVHAAMDAEASTARMNQAFKDSGVAAKKFGAGIDDAESASRKLGFTNAAVRESLGSLIVATHNGAKAIQDLSIAEDVARFKHVDLATGTKTLTMAMAGSQRAIKQLGITLAPVTTHMDALKERYKELGTAIPPAEAAQAKFLDKQATASGVIDLVSQKLKGQADAFSQTAAGGAQQFSAQIDNLKEKLGAGLLPAVTAVVEKLSAFASFLSEHTTLAKGLAIGLGGLAVALIGVSVASAIATAAMSPLLLPIAAAVVAIAGLTFVVVKLVQDFRSNWPLLLPIVLGPLGAIIAAVIHWHSEIGAAFTAAWNFVKGITERVWSAITGAVTGAMGTVGNAVVSGFHAVVATITGAVGAALSAASAVGHAIVSGIRNGLEALVGAVKAGFERAWNFLKGLPGEALAMGVRIGEAIVSGIISGLASLPGRVIGAIKSGLSGAVHAVGGFFHGSGDFLWTKYAIGIPMVDGIIDGIRARQPLLMAALRDTLGSVPTLSLGTVGSSVAVAGYPAGVQAASGFGGGFGGVNVTVNVQGALLGSTVPEVAQTIRNELLRAQRRNGNLGWT